MKATLHLETTVSINHLAQMIRKQLPAKERLALAAMLQEDDNEQLKSKFLIN